MVNYALLNKKAIVGTVILSLVLPIIPLENLFILREYTMPILFIMAEKDKSTDFLQRYLLDDFLNAQY